jgi:hypothetical protein
MEWWILYCLVPVGYLWGQDWRKFLRSFFTDLIRPWLIRGGVALIGLHWIWLLIETYLAN